jgi:hypothetical protein
VSGKDDSEGGIIGKLALAEVVLHFVFDIVVCCIEIAGLGDTGLDFVDEANIVQALDEVLWDHAHFSS